MDSRTHHMQMKYIIAQLALQNTDRFFATFGAGGDPSYLANLWEMMGEELPADERVPSEGVALWYRGEKDAPEVIVLTLPPPAARNEAYFVGVVRIEGKCRVFCLERALMPSSGEEFTIVSELAADGRSNWGPGGDPVVEEFAEMLCGLALDTSARPLAFIPVPLA